METVAVERRVTGWDIALGVLLVLAGIIVLGHTVIATAVSVLFLGWLALLSGIAAVVFAFFRIGKGGFWPIALTGGLMTVIGLMFIRNTAAAALTLTLLLGALFLTGGIIRIVAAFAETEARWVLLLGGIASAILGLIVLFNIVSATFTLIGVLLGVQLLIDGVMTMALGRYRLVETGPAV